MEVNINLVIIPIPVKFNAINKEAVFTAHVVKWKEKKRNIIM